MPDQFAVCFFVGTITAGRPTKNIHHSDFERLPHGVSLLLSRLEIIPDDPVQFVPVHPERPVDLHRLQLPPFNPAIERRPMNPRNRHHLAHGEIDRERIGRRCHLSPHLELLWWVYWVCRSFLMRGPPPALWRERSPVMVRWVRADPNSVSPTYPQISSVRLLINSCAARARIRIRIRLRIRIRIRRRLAAVRRDLRRVAAA